MTWPGQKLHSKIRSKQGNHHQPSGASSFSKMQSLWCNCRRMRTSWDNYLDCFKKERLSGCGDVSLKHLQIMKRVFMAFRLSLSRPDFESRWRSCHFASNSLLSVGQIKWIAVCLQRKSEWFSVLKWHFSIIPCWNVFNDSSQFASTASGGASDESEKPKQGFNGPHASPKLMHRWRWDVPKRNDKRTNERKKKN